MPHSLWQSGYGFTVCLLWSGYCYGLLIWWFYPNLRKPEYQRETNEWTPEKVLGLIESFVNGDLIPAIILWTSKGNYTFVIDGAHRLGALIAWVNDDYGDWEISRNFFENISDSHFFCYIHYIR